MPHVVLEGVVDLKSYAQQFEPIFLRNHHDVLRADHIFLSRDTRTVLIEALALEAGRKQPFYVKVSAHDRGGATVRIDPMTHPERSEGVRTLVAEIGADLLRRSPGARLRVTNLELPP
jgi:hypothetical protein